MSSDCSVDVVIVGGGPAGLTCAAELLARTSLTVALVDAGHEVGGQYWRQPARAAGPGALEAVESADLHHDLATFQRLRSQLYAAHDVERAAILLSHHVWAVAATGDGYIVHAVDRGRGPGGERPVTVTGRAMVIATGAFDRALPFPGWDLPGVMTAGGIQALLKAGSVLAGSRVALGGTGPFLLPVAAALAKRGAAVVGVFEASSPSRWLRELPVVGANVAKLGEGVGYGAALLRHRVPVRPRRMIVAAHGTDRVEAVSVARLDRTGRPVPGSERRLAVDAVGVGWGFTPQLDLALTLNVNLSPDAGGTPVVAVDRLQRTSRRGVYAAGETCGVGGAALAVQEGRLAGIGVAAELAGRRPDADEVADLGRRIDRLRRFGAAMMRAHPVPAGWVEALTPDTVLCRCEEVPLSAVRAAIDERGASDARQVKQLTRTGMGWCQGRVCGYATSLLCSGGPGDPVERLVAAPVPLGVVADSVPNAM